MTHIITVCGPANCGKSTSLNKVIDRRTNSIRVGPFPNDRTIIIVIDGTIIVIITGGDHADRLNAARTNAQNAIDIQYPGRYPDIIVCACHPGGATIATVQGWCGPGQDPVIIPKHREPDHALRNAANELTADAVIAAIMEVL